MLPTAAVPVNIGARAAPVTGMGGAHFREAITALTTGILPVVLPVIGVVLGAIAVTRHTTAGCPAAAGSPEIA